MSKILFINACMRGDASRTLTLCREYLQGKESVIEVDLTTLDIKPFNATMVTERTALQKAGKLDDSTFDLARQFAEADEIIVGAPYWDMAFPATLRIYFEHVSVYGIVFRYTKQGAIEGLCNAPHITYITTCGGALEGANYGYDYVVGLGRMFGISDVRLIAAEGLDIVGQDVEAQMDKARAAIKQYAN